MNDRGKVPSFGGPRLADRLVAARRARFVGRTAELELFGQSLTASEPPFAVAHVVGPGGIGKTTLLQEFACMAAATGRSVVRIDARHIEPRPEDFMAALAHALDVDGGPAAAMAARW